MTNHITDLLDGATTDWFADINADGTTRHSSHAMRWVPPGERGER